MVEVSVLGRVAVTIDGERATVPGGRTTELLVRLALEAGTAVRADRLLDELWHDDGFVTRNTLQSKVVKLRRALGDRAAVVSRDGGYALDVDPRSVDALAVVEQAASARALLEAGDADGAAETSAAALDEFDGEVLTGAGDGPWAIPHRTRLESTWLELAVTRGAALLRLGRATAAADELELAVTRHPYQESLWAVYVRAIYQSGRPADALAAVQRLRALLDDDLGLTPGPELVRLEHQILVHDAALDPATTVRPAPSPAGPRGNLPSLQVDLVGRDTEVAEVVSLVGRHRLVEVIGTGGVGKTALAIAAARAMTPTMDAWLVRLETATSAVEVADATIAAFGVVGGETALFERLRTGTNLVVVDNCEHLLDHAAAWVVRLLDSAPELRILCTSQAPLDVDGEVVFELEPLGIGPAVELFGRRAAAQRTRTPTGDDGAGVEELCRALDGLPLAIELAAARTKTLSVADITRRLDDRFFVLADPSSRRPERRRALRATIGWSYDLLFPDDQRGLWALASFAGGASLAAVEHVLVALGVPGPAAIDVVDRLVSRSLVIVDDGATGTRYRLLDSIRAFSLEAMAAGDATGAAHEAHAAWFVDAARSSTAGVRSTRQAAHLAVARAERANIDAALGWLTGHDPQRALELATGFGWAWVVVGDARGAERFRTALAALGDGAPAADRADALLLLGWIEASSERLGPARAHVLEAAALAEDLGDTALLGRCDYHLAYVVSHHGEFRDAIELTDRARTRLAGDGSSWDRAANGLFGLRAAISAGDVDRSVAVAHDVASQLAEVDDPWLHVRYEAMLGELARLEHRFDDAVAHLERALATSLSAGYRQTAAYQMATLGRAQWQRGDDAGIATLREAVERAEAIGDVRMAALARVHLGRVVRASGDMIGARHVLEQTVGWHRRAGGGEQALLGECLLGAIDLALGDDTARSQVESILADARARPDAPAQVFALDALALDAARQGLDDVARAHLADADEAMAVAAHFISERDRVDAEATLRALAGA